MRHLLDTKDLSRDDAIRILDIAESMTNVRGREIKKFPTLRGMTVANLFFEDSTRTRTSFEAAAKRMSADVITFTARGSSVSKGESLKDTAQTLEAIGADAIVIRHSSSGAALRLAETDWVEAAIVNAGDGMHAHPTQALLDAFTLRRELATRRGTSPQGTGLDGAHVVIVGDILHSRVARSNVWLLSLLGARVTLVAPPTLMPHSVQGWPAEVTYDLDEAIAEGPDALMTLRVQAERMQGAFFPSPSEYTRRWGLTPARHTAMKPGSIVMHPGPMNRGLEISSVAADAKNSRILDQVSAGVAVRMAVLYMVLAGDTATIERASV